MTRIGGWLFRRRTVIPLPLALVVLSMPARLASGPPGLVATGVVLVALGEAMRIWGVRHIGVISRTRSERLGPLVDSGPFALVRNPLYIGNILLWVGFAISARLLWLAPIFMAVLAFEYHAIVRWEERLLDQRLGERYRAYAARVPRWVPRRFTRDTAPASAATGTSVFSWRETFYSERGTLVAIAIGFALIWLKAWGVRLTAS